MKNFFLIYIVTIVLCWAVPGQVIASSAELRLKAAYLYNFAKFMHWPDEASLAPDTPLVICVVGHDTLKDELIPLTSKQVRNRPIEIRSLTGTDDLRGCHLLYIAPDAFDRVKNVLTPLAGLPVVTIGENENFAAQGGVVQLVTRRDRLRFIINLGAAKENQIQIDSQLLSLASEVLEEKDE